MPAASYSASMRMLCKRSTKRFAAGRGVQERRCSADARSDACAGSGGGRGGRQAGRAGANQHPGAAGAAEAAGGGAVYGPCARGPALAGAEFPSGPLMVVKPAPHSVSNAQAGCFQWHQAHDAHPGALTQRWITPFTLWAESVHSKTSSTQDLDLVKLTAQFVARNGKGFLTDLAMKETRNQDFNFLKPTHSMFTFFTALCDAYSKVLMPPAGTSDKLRKDAADRCGILIQIGGSDLLFVRQIYLLLKKCLALGRPVSAGHCIALLHSI